LKGEGGSNQASKQATSGSSIPCHHDDDAQYSHSFIHSFIHINPANFLIARERHKQTAKPC
jgi:hypothetical protein